MPVTPIRALGSPIPAIAGPEPLGAATCAWRSPALLRSYHTAMPVEQDQRPAGEGMALLIPPAGGELSSQSLNGGVRLELLPPALVTTALHPFFTLFRRHQCPPPALS